MDKPKFVRSIVVSSLGHIEVPGEPTDGMKKLNDHLKAMEGVQLKPNRASRRRQKFGKKRI